MDITASMNTPNNILNIKFQLWISLPKMHQPTSSSIDKIRKLGPIAALNFRVAAIELPKLPVGESVMLVGAVVQAAALLEQLMECYYCVLSHVLLFMEGLLYRGCLISFFFLGYFAYNYTYIYIYIISAVLINFWNIYIKTK